jgi:hypothetical protein
MSQRLLPALHRDPRMFKNICVSVSNALLISWIARLMQSLSVDAPPTMAAGSFDVRSSHCARMRNYHQ